MKYWSRLSAAGVLDDHQARHLAQDVGDLRARAVPEVLRVEVHRRRGLRGRGVVDLDHLLVRDRLAIGAVEDRQSFGVELDAIGRPGRRDRGGRQHGRGAPVRPNPMRARVGGRHARRSPSPLPASRDPPLPASRRRLRCTASEPVPGDAVLVVQTKRARMRTRARRRSRRPQISKS